MNSAKKVASGVIWSFIVNIVNALYGFISVPILIHYFGKAEYGIIGLAMSVNVYMQLMDMGFNSTNVRFFATWLAKGNKEKTNKLFQTSLAFYGVIGILNGMILLIVSWFSESLFHLTAEQDEILKNLFYVLAISAIISWYSSCFDQLIKATENVAWIQRRSLFPKLLQIVVLFVTVYGRLSILAYFLLTTFAMFAIIPWSVQKIKQETPFAKFTPRFDSQSFREILPYCLNIFSFSLFQFSFYNLRPVFLGIQGSVESVADFRVLNGIMGLITMFGGAFLGVLLPSTSKIVAQGNKDAYYRVAYAGTKYITIVVCFCSFGLMAVGPELIRLYVGEQFLYLLPWYNLWLLCMLGVHNQAISSLILSGADIRAITYNTVVASIIGLLLSWFLIPYYQIGGVVVAHAVYMVIQLLFYYLYYWPRKMQINSLKVFSYSFIPYTVVGGILAIILSVCVDISANAWMSFFIKGVVFAIAFSIIVLLLFTRSDRDFIMSLIKKK